MRGPVSLLSPVEIVNRLEGLTFADLIDLMAFTEDSQGDESFIVGASVWFAAVPLRKLGFVC